MCNLKDKLAAGKFTVTVELDPPKSAAADKTVNEALKLINVVDAVNIADSPMANLRMSPIALAHIIETDVGLETVFHLTCRDRNVIGIQAELLGAAALGVHNILALGGDPPSRGDHPQARGIFETDSVGLIKLAAGLNNGQDSMGNTLGSSSSFFIGTAVNPCADDLDAEIAKLTAKVAAGARFVQTQPVYDVAVARSFMNQISHLPIYVLIGVLPLKSYKMALYLHDKVPGVVIPDAIMRRMADGGKLAGLQIATEIIDSLQGVAHGVHIMPLNDIDTVIQITANLADN